MAGPGNILIKIGAEASQALGEFDKVNSKMGDTATKSQKVGAALKSAAVPATIALGVIAVGAKKAIDSAAELEKQVQKTSAVFGPSADSIVKWSEDLAKSFGLSSGEALQAAGKFGNLFVNLGYSQKQAAGMSEQMTQLAADMASFNNVPVDETMAALQSGLSGATRGLKKYGVVIDSTALKTEAMRQGLYSGKGAMDAHAKAAATLTLVMQQTSKAQGDFAKHSADSANATAIQKAEMANLSEELGGALLPYYEAAEQILVSLTGKLGEHTTAIKVAVGVTAALAGGILVANAAWKAYTIATNVASVATKIFTASNRAAMISLATNPITIAIVALVALGVVIVELYKHSATFRSIVHAALADVEAGARSLGAGFRALENAASAAFDWIVSHWRIAAFALGPIGAGLVVVVDHFNSIRSAASSAFAVVESAIRAVTSAVEALISALGKIHVPSIHLPHIPGTLALAPGYAPAPALAGYGPLTRGAVPAAGGRAAISSSSASPSTSTGRPTPRAPRARSRASCAGTTCGRAARDRAPRALGRARAATAGARLDRRRAARRRLDRARPRARLGRDPARPRLGRRPDSSGDGLARPARALARGAPVVGGRRRPRGRGHDRRAPLYRHDHRRRDRRRLAARRRRAHDRGRLDALGRRPAACSRARLAG